MSTASHPGKRKPIDDLSDGAIEILGWIRRKKRLPLVRSEPNQIWPEALELESEGHIRIEPDYENPARRFYIIEL